MSNCNGVVGCNTYDLDTPALLVDLAAMERNVATIASQINRNGVNWRPHTKGQKVPALAHKELAAGAIGVTCSKLGEAEVMAMSGIRDILITGQVVGPQKVMRLVNLLPHADVIVPVDSPENVAELDAAARVKGVRLRVVIEVDTGMGRCGVQPGQPVVDLARRIADAPGLKFVGVMAWEGHCCRILDEGEKRACVEQAVGKLTGAAQLCRAAGLPVEIVSCGGTGTYRIASAIPGVTEVQAGGGVFHDVHYEEHYAVRGLAFSLTIMTTVISRPTPSRIVVDAGRKAMSCDAAMPRPIGVDGVEQMHLSAEHGRIELAEANPSLKVGDKLEFICGYSDTTVFLHDDLYGIRDGKVEVVWPILGRGKLR
jgi:D-serine deaminase-like pyridoxal phosphate-dependent protein